MVSSRETIDSEPTSDFVDHLQQRLGIRRDEALAILSDWVSHYQPRRRRDLSHDMQPDHVRRHNA